MCVYRAQQDWKIIGAEYVERGGQTWPKKIVESHTHTKKLKARHPTLVYDPV